MTERKSKKTKNLDKANLEFLKYLSKEVSLTEKQSQLVDEIGKNIITFVSGCWGTSKTFVACYAAYQLLATNEYSRIIITKPIVEAGENLGFLKGDLNDKVAPYSESYWETFSKIADEIFITKLREEGSIQFKPVAYMRGNNYDKNIIILDEAQNLNEKQIMLVLSRLGKGSKMIVIGDRNQTDIPDKHSGFMTFMHILKGVEGIGFFEFTVDDIMREPILIEISKRYEEWKYNVAGSEVRTLMKD